MRRIVNIIAHQFTQVHIKGSMNDKFRQTTYDDSWQSTPVDSIMRYALRYTHLLINPRSWRWPLRTLMIHLDIIRGAGSAILLNACFLSLSASFFPPLFFSLFLHSRYSGCTLAAGHLRDAGEYTRRTSAGAAAAGEAADSSCRFRARARDAEGWQLLVFL